MEGLGALLSRVSCYGIIPEIMLEAIDTNVEVWIENYLKKELSSADSCCPCFQTACFDLHSALRLLSARNEAQFESPPSFPQGH